MKPHILIIALIASYLSACFTSTEAGNQLVDFITINNTRYTIANRGDLANNYSVWQVIKERK